MKVCCYYKNVGLIFILIPKLIYNCAVIYFYKALGLHPSPFDCFLLNRSIKTFPLRIREQSTSALKIANFLETHPAVSYVVYPGTSSFMQTDLFRKQMSGFGCVVLFELNGTPEDAHTFVHSLKVSLYCSGFIDFK